MAIRRVEAAPGGGQEIKDGDKPAMWPPGNQAAMEEAQARLEKAAAERAQKAVAEGQAPTKAAASEPQRLQSASGGALLESLREDIAFYETEIAKMQGAKEHARRMLQRLGESE